MTQTQYALQRTTQAIKDILGAAQNGEPYSPDELTELFLDDYNVGYAALNHEGIEEIA